MTEKTHHVAEKKKKIAENIQRLILEYPIIAAVNMENLPTPQLQQMRAQLRDKIILTMTKRRIMKHAIKSIKGKKKNIEQLEAYLKGMPALIFTKENPFSLYKTLKKNKSSAPAKAGQTAPFDIKVTKGPTSFAPGPIIGELAQIGVKTGVEGGKVVIKEDSVVVKEGEKISAKVAEILTRLGIEPMEVGLNVTAIYEDGDIFPAKVLDIDEDKFKADLQRAARWAFNLAVYSAYPTKGTITILIGKAFNDAKALGLSQNIIDEGIIGELLGKAEISALNIKSAANIEVTEKPKKDKAKEKKEEVKKEEPKVKEKKEEVKEELNVTETLIEEKEEEILEEEEKIIEEEKRLEKQKPEEAPIEEEVQIVIKEEEEKQLEKERMEKEKEFEEIEKQKLESKKTEEKEDEIDKKIAEMVSKTKRFVKGEIPSAEKLIEEAGKLAAQERKKERPKEFHKVKEKEEETREKKQQQEVENLAQELIRKGTLRK